MQYGSGFGEEIVLFKNKYNVTLRNIPCSKKTKKSDFQLPVQLGTSNHPSSNSIPVLEEAVMIKSNKTSCNISDLSESSGCQTQSSISSQEDDGWIHVPYKQKPKVRPKQANSQKASLVEIRDHLNNLFNERFDKQQMLMKQVSKESKMKLSNDIFNLTAEIGQLKEQSRLREIQWIKENPHLINIHDGYRSEEIEELFSMIVSVLQNEYKKGNSRIFPQRKNGEWVICLKVLTGKGNHSKKNISVLKESVYKWAKHNAGFHCIPKDDHNLLYIPISP